jgi:hypothetical protein
VTKATGVVAAVVLAVLMLATCSNGGTGGLRIAPDLFVSGEDGTASNEVVMLSGDFDVHAAVTALGQTAERIMLVDDKGTEYATEEDVEAAEQRYEPGYFYTPNYVADPEVLPDGIRLYVDCKGVIPPAMARTFQKILREELTRSGIKNARVRNAPG